MENLLKLPSDGLTTEQKAALQCLYHHFTVTSAMTGFNPDSGQETAVVGPDELAGAGRSELECRETGHEDDEGRRDETDSLISYGEHDSASMDYRQDDAIGASQPTHEVTRSSETATDSLRCQRTGLGKRTRQRVPFDDSDNGSDSEHDGRPSESEHEFGQIRRQEGAKFSPKRVHRSPRASTRATLTHSPWSRFLRLTPHDLQLPATVQEYLDEYGTNAAMFLTDIDTVDELSTSVDSVERGNAFSSRYSYTLSLQARRQKDTVRWGVRDDYVFRLGQDHSSLRYREGRMPYTQIPSRVPRGRVRVRGNRS